MLATDLLPTAEEEFIRVNAIADGAANEGDPVKDDWRLILVLEKHLRQDVDED